ncbi:MAG: ABC transporter ATP-binding protein [Clostridia bacterium]|nr:ABC transporter ATP-binding protein [Clostridia bacterium]
MKQPTISLKNVVKYFEDTQVVKNLNLDIREGEFFTLLGPSGCGKTTTLRLIAGFEILTEGKIFLEGIDVSAKKPNERSVNTVFQNYALFPHMNVEENIAFGLVEKKVKKAEIKQKVAEMLKLVQLEGMEKRMPSQMSGGQKQRVAIARALANDPKVLLLDEPLGALDLKLRKQMQLELKHLQKNLGVTFVFVTHDQEEALAMSDRIGVMNNGVLEQIGTPQEIYNQPVTKFVADFIGETNLLDASVEKVSAGEIYVKMEFGHACLKATGFFQNEMVYICVRPENLKITAGDTPNFHIYGKVKEHVFIGSVSKTVVELANGQEIKLTTPQMENLYPVGAIVNIYWKDDHGVILRTREEQVYTMIENTMRAPGGSDEG